MRKRPTKTRHLLLAVAAMLVSTPAMADGPDAGAQAPNVAAAKIMAQNIIMPSATAAMDLCEYEHALSSPGWIVEMPVHIRGVTDDRNMSRCVGGRWLPAANVRLEGDGKR